MYGMVNKAIEEMLLAQYGTTAWAAIKRRAGVKEEVFVSTEAYPDELTYALITAAADCTGVPTAELLHRFGEHWVLHTATTDYGHLLAGGGGNVEEFLLNLPRFHDRVSLLFPNLQPPRFEIADRTAHSLRLRCTSARPGLTPFVVGLISGIGQRFQTPLAITVEQSRDQNGGTDVLRVEWSP